MGKIQRRKPRHERIRTIIDRRPVRGFKIPLAQREPGEDYGGRIGRSCVRARGKTREAAAGSDPDGSVFFRSEPVQIAVVPDQAIVGVKVSPAAVIPDVDAVRRSGPQAVAGVEAEKVYEPGAILLAIVLAGGQMVD